MNLNLSSASVRLSFGLLVIIILLASPADCGGNKKHKYKYTAEANAPPLNRFDDDFALETNELPQTPPERIDSDMRTLHKPFRMAKLNMVWSKAQQRLTEPKLKSLFTDLKLHDKEELSWKQQNGQHTDKDGLKVAELRKKMINIMSTYGLLEHFDDGHHPDKYKHHKSNSDHDKQQKKDSTYKNKSLFKDKKLNKLWEKAEVSGFTAEELSALREEFHHHQDKVDMYYSILERADERQDERHENAVNEDEFDRFNEITPDDKGNVVAASHKAADVSPNAKNNAYLDDANLLREKHRDLRDNYDRLERIAAKGPKNQEFIEPKVQGLWRVAAASNFSTDELDSLKIELLHYESRLLKLRHLHAEQALNREKYKDAEHRSKHDKYAGMEEHIRKQARKVEKIHDTLEQRIFKHSEL